MLRIPSSHARKRDNEELGMELQSFRQKAFNQAGSSRNAALESRTDASEAVPAEDLTVQQLELMLAQRRLVEEQSYLHGTTNAVLCQRRVVGPTVYLVKVRGVLVQAMVDTGSQSTIISWSLLQEIGCSLQQTGNLYLNWS